MVDQEKQQYFLSDDIRHFHTWAMVDWLLPSNPGSQSQDHPGDSHRTQIFTFTTRIADWPPRFVTSPGMKLGGR